MDYLNIEYFAHVGVYLKNSQSGECRNCHQLLQTMSSTVVGEVESLVAALHSSLLNTDRELQELGAEEEGLEAWHKTQQGQFCLYPTHACDHVETKCVYICDPQGPHMIMIQSGQVENHFQSLVQKVEEVKVGVLGQLAKQVTASPL